LITVIRTPKVRSHACISINSGLIKVISAEQHTEYVLIIYES